MHLSLTAVYYCLSRNNINFVPDVGLHWYRLELAPEALSDDASVCGDPGQSAWRDSDGAEPWWWHGLWSSTCHTASTGLHTHARLGLCYATGVLCIDLCSRETLVSIKFDKMALKLYWLTW